MDSDVNQIVHLCNDRKNINSKEQRLFWVLNLVLLGFLYLRFLVLPGMCHVIQHVLKL